jgi:hypothetical protein
LAVGKFVFRHDALNLVGLNAVSQAAIRLDRHALDDGVNLRQLDLNPTLRSLAAVKDFFVQLVGM